MRDARTMLEIEQYYDQFLTHLQRDHEYPNVRHEYIKNRLRSAIKPGMNILDMGCGTGIISRFMGELGATVTAVDLSKKIIAYAREHSGHPNVTYVPADITDMIMAGKYDAITIIDAFEHVPAALINKLMTTIKVHSQNDTVLYLNIPDGRSTKYLRERHPERLQIIDESYSIPQVIQLLEGIGFELIDIGVYGIEYMVQYNEFTFMPAGSAYKYYEMFWGKKDNAAK